MKEEYRKGSFCLVGACLEVRIGPTSVEIRHSANKSSNISVSRDDWKIFTDEIKAGKLDLSCERR